MSPVLECHRCSPTEPDDRFLSLNVEFTFGEVATDHPFCMVDERILDNFNLAQIGFKSNGNIDFKVARVCDDP